MATIVPNVSSSQALITPGYPMVQVAHSNPMAVTQLNEGTTTSPTGTSAITKKALTQSGHDSDRS